MYRSDISNLSHNLAIEQYVFGVNCQTRLRWDGIGLAILRLEALMSILSCLPDLYQATASIEIS